MCLALVKLLLQANSVFLSNRILETRAMASEDERVLILDHRAQQSRYDYFLMAVAGSAIALSVQRTTGAALCWSMIPLAFAVLLWGSSFYGGCRRRGYADVVTYANIALLRVQQGEHSEAGTNPALMQAASDGIRDAITTDATKAQWWGHFQFKTLVGGAVTYVVWHVLEMTIATYRSGAASGAEVIKSSLEF